MARPILAVRDRIDNADGVLVHRGASASTALVPGVKAMSVERYFG